jgi:hypothetical protein
VSAPERTDSAIGRCNGRKSAYPQTCWRTAPSRSGALEDMQDELNALVYRLAGNFDEFVAR